MEKRVCKVYKPETVSQYTKVLGNNWMQCSNCWGKGGRCTFVREADLKDEEEKYRLDGGLPKRSESSEPN